MKVTIFTFVFFLGIAANAQTHAKCSIEFSGEYLYYYVNENSYSVDFNNHFNYGFSLLWNNYFNENVKFRTGINFSTKRLFYKIDTLNYKHVSKKEYTYQYFNIPVLLDFRVYHKRNLNLSISGGLILSNIVNYYVIEYYYDQPTKFKSNPDIGRKPGLTIHSGVKISRYFARKLLLSLEGFINFKSILDFNDKMPSNVRPTDDRLFFGIGLGLEYIVRIRDNKL